LLFDVSGYLCPPNRRSPHPAYVLVNKNGVVVAIRTSLDYYSLLWYQAPDSADRWQLEARAEGSRRVLFSTN